jgi:NADPH:quinone reductase-like Zn-dependent oxidoreductase
VEAVGSGCGLPVGARVVPSAPRAATWASHSTVPSCSLFPVPDAVPDDAAATMAVNPPTAVALLSEFGALSAGDAVAQNGATTAVGRLVLQLAAHRALRTFNIVRDRGPVELAAVKAELTALGGGPALATVLSEAEADAARGSVPSDARLGLNCVGGRAAGAVLRLLR